MTKLILNLLVLVFLTQNAHASEKAFTILLSYGLNAQDLVSVVAKYPELSDLDVSSENHDMNGEEFTKHLSLKLYAEETNDAYIISKVDSAVSIEKVEVHPYMEVKTIAGVITSTLYETIFKETKSARLANLMEEAFREDFSSTKGLKIVPRYQMRVEQFFDDGQVIKYGYILDATLTIGRAVSRNILNINQETSEWMLFPENFDSNNRPFYEPVKSSRISSLFQLNRRHPITRRHQPHNGVDFVSPSGSPIYPALDGVVTAIARARAKGKYITIHHDNGYTTTYDHLRVFKKGLRVGMRVGVNDKIGEVGRTGFSTGAHLHFGVMKDGFYVNPIYLLKSYTYSEKEKYEIIDEASEE